MFGRVLIVLAALAATASAQSCLSFLFYTSATNIVTYSTANLTDILSNPNFNRQRVTALYMYGFQQAISTPSVVQVRDAYLQNGNHNFLLMDCDGSYTAVNANSLADEVSDVLLQFFNVGYESWHIVGFSLGAQIAGMTGRHVRRKSLRRHSVPRITGLDPGQLPIGLFSDINADDANFVDIIHVETVHFGTVNAVGHVNFWVNGGVTQPMCTGAVAVVVATCAHLMAPTYWSETLTANNPNIFRSQQCESWNVFVNNQCGNTPTSPMGIGVNFNARGNYFLRTNLVAPFSLT